MQMGTQLFTNLVWRSNAHTAVRKTSSEREKNIYINKKTKKEKKKQQQEEQETNKQKMGNWSRPGQTV